MKNLAAKIFQIFRHNLFRGWERRKTFLSPRWQMFDLGKIHFDLSLLLLFHQKSHMRVGFFLSGQEFSRRAPLSFEKNHSSYLVQTWGPTLIESFSELCFTLEFYFLESPQTKHDKAFCNSIPRKLFFQIFKKKKKIFCKILHGLHLECCVVLRHFPKLSHAENCT